MAEATKRVNPERDPISDEEVKEELVNDSLGTVDTADATGLDSVDPTGGDKPSEGPARPEDKP